MKIFLSHSSKDSLYADLIVHLLRGVGVKEHEIVYTSNVAYGIPVGQNIFSWLKSQIEEKPFVLYLLSERYYKSVACLNEMGAAWIIENEHAAVFTPDFSIDSKEFKGGALDPREIGFYINNEERILSFIQLLSKSFEITGNNVIMSQYVKKFISDISEIRLPAEHVALPKKEFAHGPRVADEGRVAKIASSDKKLAVKSEKSDLFSKFIGEISGDKLKSDELLLLHYIVDRSSVKLGTGWQEKLEIQRIEEWEKINDLKPILSNNYASAIRRFDLRGYTEVSEVTNYHNPKEVKLKDEIGKHILDLPSPVLKKIANAVKSNYFKHKDDSEDFNDFPY